MPGITIIGDSRGAARSRPTSLPAEARSLSRFLRLLQTPEISSDALLQAISALSEPVDTMKGAALHCIQQQVSKTIHDMREAGWNTFADRYAEYNMALAVESVLQNASSYVPGSAVKPQQSNQKTQSTSNTQSVEEGDDSSSDDSSKIIPTNANTRKHAPSSPLSVSSLESGAKQVPGAAAAATTTTRRAVRKRQAAAMVSDSSSTELSEAGEEVMEKGVVTKTQTEAAAAAKEDQELSRSTAAKYLWAIILESLHLQVASRTTKVWGRKKIYEVYQLARPAQSTPPSQQQFSLLRQSLETELRSTLVGTLSDASHCRVYLALQPFSVAEGSIVQALFVQFNLGKIVDLQDESNRSKSGEKKKKAGLEFVAIVIPGSTLFCLTASRAPSRARFTPYILATLENVLTEITSNVAAIKATTSSTKGDMKELAVKRFGDLSGTEPHELLRSARSVATGEAVGRFAHMAASDQSNPIADLHMAATATMLNTTTDSESTRLQVGAKQPGNAKVAKVAAHVSAASEGTAALVAANQSGTNLWIDHSVQQKQSRKRSREEALGRSKDCPNLQRVCWKWTGETTAASACWVDSEEGDSASKAAGEMKKTEFKCALVMHGENVLQGLQALVEEGLAEAPLPDFMRNAPSMGGTIRVEHGAFVPKDTAFEAV